MIKLKVFDKYDSYNPAFANNFFSIYRMPHQDEKVQGVFGRIPNTIYGVMDDSFNLSLNFGWDEGVTAGIAKLTDQIFGQGDSNMINGQIYQIINGVRQPSILHTDQYSQMAMKTNGASSLKASIKFRSYYSVDKMHDKADPDAFDENRQFERVFASDYRTVLKFCSAACSSPLEYSMNNLKQIFSGMVNELASGSAGKRAMNGLEGAKGILTCLKDALSSKTLDVEALKYYGQKLNDMLGSGPIGTPAYQLTISNFLTGSVNVPWVITKFEAKPCMQFYFDGPGLTSDNDYKPKPLYFDFTIELETTDALSSKQMSEIIDPAPLTRCKMGPTKNT